ncbi:MAG: uroporphyrinogen decarboxylase, partial [Roseiflexus sp.]|nr:uroporphyrinogen decarboxylase [Roseiflexus sp.]
MTRSRFLAACRRQPVDATPVWFMRQAGRYMPEYRAIRERYGFLEMVKTPELAAAITMQPILAFPVDAAIIFADILPLLEGMGLHLTYEQGEGPVIHNPVRSPADVAALRTPDPRETVAYTIQAIRLVKRDLEGRAPLIGFSGAPFTLAAYAIEGGSSRDHRLTKALMYAEPQAWHELMERLTAQVSTYLIAQIEAGADAVQVFDSWAGALSPGDYAEYVLPFVQKCIVAVRAGCGIVPPPPIIYFGVGLSGMLGLLRQTDADVIGLDWRIHLDDGWAQTGPGVAVQGNLDPHTLLAPWPEVRRRAADILDRAAGR